MKYRVRWCQHQPDGTFREYFLVSCHAGWHFTPAVDRRPDSLGPFSEALKCVGGRKAGLCVFSEAMKILDQYFSSVSQEDGGRSDFLRVEREDGVAVVSRHSRYHPNGKGFEVLDECVRPELDAYSEDRARRINERVMAEKELGPYHDLLDME
jgi:hypothetical protein